MKITFDHEVAKVLAATSREVAGVVSDQNTTRSDGATTALTDFSGPYKSSFERVCKAESTDRSNLKSALESLAIAVERAAEAARQEQERLDKVRAWEQRRDARVPGGHLAGHSSYTPMVYKDLPTTCAAGAQTADLFKFSIDPEPSRIPIPPPSMDVSFSAQTRDRSAASGAKGTDVVSADPAKLRTFVDKRTSSDKTMEDAFTTLRSSWSSFTSSCSWASTAGVTIFSGINTYQEENHGDRIWISSIADAFQNSNQRNLQVIDVQSQLAGKDPRYKEEAIRTIKDPRLTLEETQEAARKFAAIPGNESAAADLAQDLLETANNERTADSMNRAAAVITGISDSPRASAATLRKIKAEGLIEGMETAILYANSKRTYAQGSSYSMSYSNPSMDLALPEALKALLSAGEQEIARQNPEESRVLAQGIVDSLNSPSISGRETLSKDHPYIVSYLLQDNTLSTPFLTTAGHLLEKMEKDSGKNRHLWKERTSTYSSLAYATGQPILSVNPDSEASKLGSGYDPVAAYMSALGNNPEASLRFFTGEGANHPDEILSTEEALERQKYWIMRREWSHDKFSGLAAALSSATASPENAGSIEASKLATNSVELLGYRSRGEDLSAGNSQERSISFTNDQEKLKDDALSAEAALDFAKILTTYMPSIDIAISEDRKRSESSLNQTTAPLDSRVDLTGLEDLPVFNTTDLRVLTQAVLDTPEGLAAMREGVTAYQDAQIYSVAQQYGESPELKHVLREASNGGAGIEGWYVDNIKEITIQDEKERNKMINYWIDESSDIAKAAASLAPTSKVPLVSALADYATSMTIDSIADSAKEYATTSDEEIESKAEEMKEEFKESRLHRNIGILRETGIISNAHIRDIAGNDRNKGIDPEEWISMDSYPSYDDLKSTPGAASFSRDLARDYIDIDEFRDTYDDAASSFK